MSEWEERVDAYRYRLLDLEYTPAEITLMLTAFAAGWTARKGGLREEWSIRWDGDPKMGGGSHESGISRVWGSEQEVRESIVDMPALRAKPGFRIVRRMVSETGWEVVQ